MDSLGQTNLGLSERFWIIRLKNTTYKQKMFLHKFRDPQMSKNQPPGQILKHFLYRSGLKRPAQITGTIRITWKPLNWPQSEASEFYKKDSAIVHLIRCIGFE